MTQNYHYEHPDIFPADYWSISVVDCVTLCFIPDVSISSCIQPCPLCSLIFAVSNTWHTEVMNSRLRHNSHCLLVPSSRNLGVDQRQLLRDSDIKECHFEDLGAALGHYF